MFRQNGKIHYSFWILVISFLFQFFVVTLTYHAPGQFVAPMATDMNLERSEIMTSLSLGSIFSMCIMLFAGEILKKVNLKFLFCVTMFLFSCLYMVQSYATTLLQLNIISIARGILSPFCSMYPITIIMNNWFGKRMIGKMVTYAMIGNSVGCLVMNPIIGFLIRDYGWRTCYRVITVIPILIIPFIALFIKITPEEKGLSRIGDDPVQEDVTVLMDNQGLTAVQAVRTSKFWISTLMFLVWAGSTSVWQLIGPQFLTDTGRDPVEVASVLSVAAFGNLIGKLILGPLYEKNSRNGLIFGFFMGFLSFCLAIASNWVSALAYVASFTFGFCIGTVGAVPALVTAELFGRKDYGVISGFIQIGGSVGSSFLPLLMSFVYVILMNYVKLWSIMSILVLTSILLLILSFHKNKKGA